MTSRIAAKPKMEGLGILQVLTFVTKNLDKARDFYVDRLGWPLEREESGDYFMVRVGTLRLCVDRAAKEEPAQGGGSNLIFQVHDLDQTGAELSQRGIAFERRRGRGEYIEVRDPEGYKLIFTEKI